MVSWAPTLMEHLSCEDDSVPGRGQPKMDFTSSAEK